MSGRLLVVAVAQLLIVAAMGSLTFWSIHHMRRLILAERADTHQRDTAVDLQITADRIAMGTLDYLATGDRTHRDRVATAEREFTQALTSYGAASTDQDRGYAPRLLALHRELIETGTALMNTRDRLRTSLPNALERLEEAQSHTTVRFMGLGVALAQVGPPLTLHLQGNSADIDRRLRQQLDRATRMARTLLDKEREVRAGDPDRRVLSDERVLMVAIDALDRLQHAMVLQSTIGRGVEGFRALQLRIDQIITSEVHSSASRRIRQARDAVASAWRRLQVAAASLLVTFVGVLVWMVWFLRRSVLHPIDVLARAADGVHAHTLAFRLPAPPTVEYAPLVTSMNLMLDRLEEATVSKERLESGQHALQQSIAALRASEERFRQLFEGMRGGVAYCELVRDTDGNATDWICLTANPALERQIGIGTLAGRRATDLTANLREQCPDLLQLFERVVTTGRPEVFEGHVKKPIDAWMRIATFRPIPHHFVAICEDIGEARRARVALETAVSEWRNTFDAVEWAIVIVDHDRRIRRLNRAALRTVGGSFESWIGRAFDTMTTSEPWSGAGDLVTAALTGTAQSVNVEVISPDGTIWDVASTGVGDSTGGPTAIVIARDISAVVELQRAVRRSESMAEMGALVAGVAHEVRNPLFGISSILDAWQAKGSSANVDHYRQVLRKEVDRMRRLMVELLEYGRPYSHDLKVEDVQHLIDEAVHSCESLAAQRKVRIAAEVDPAVVFMDPSRLVRVFTNLIENAIQHSPEGGTVRIEGRVTDQGIVEIAVLDEGPGFKPDDVDRVFKPFFSRRAGGFGLGLAIVQRIIEEHRGSAQVVERRGGGGHVVVRLPMSTAWAGAA